MSHFTLVCACVKIYCLRFCSKYNVVWAFSAVLYCGMYLLFITAEDTLYLSYLPPLGFSPWFHCLSHLSDCCRSFQIVIIVTSDYKVDCNCASRCEHMFLYTWHSLCRTGATRPAVDFLCLYSLEINNTKGQHQVKRHSSLIGSHQQAEASIQTNVYSDVLAKHYTVRTVQILDLF